MITRPLVLVLVLTLGACEPTEGRDLCADLSFAAPSCSFAPDGCAWRANADCDETRADRCIAEIEAAYAASSATCTPAIRDAWTSCDACL